MIRAVLFDLDGVVRHFSADRVDAIERRYGLASGSIEASAFASPLIEQVTTGQLSRAEWVAGIGAEIGCLAAAIEWGNQPFDVDPEVLVLVEELRVLGLGTAILTNGTDTIPEEVASVGLTHKFDPIVTSSAIGYAKPDPRAFSHVLELLALAAEQVFFTDDSTAKLRGAAVLGMATHHFTGVSGLREALWTHGIPVRPCLCDSWTSAEDP